MHRNNNSDWRRNRHVPYNRESNTRGHQYSPQKNWQQRRRSEMTYDNTRGSQDFYSSNSNNWQHSNRHRTPPFYSNKYPTNVSNSERHRLENRDQEYRPSFNTDDRASQSRRMAPPSNYRPTNDRNSEVQGNRDQEYRSHFNIDSYDENIFQSESECLQEDKVVKLMNSVLSQPGVLSELIILETEENKPLQTLQGSLDSCQALMIVDQDTTGEFVLKINGKEYSRGIYQTKQIARNSLADETLSDLKKCCFYIQKKKIYEEVDTNTQTESVPQTSFEGSKAHQMMLKMGWGGKGLGINEQGEEKTVAETISDNVSKQGLGNRDVFKEISKILEDFGKSNKLSILRFAPDFSSDERAHIHKIAAKFGLKSKSEGKGEQRRITISKKLNRKDLVYQLLSGGCENSVYKLFIPENFTHLWDE